MTLNFIGWMIVACEVAFWIVIIIGLITRYMLKQEKLGMVFFALVPLIDVVLFLTAGANIYFGAAPTMAHAVAAVYIGISIAFGKDMIAWMDERFQYYIMRNGIKTVKRHGREYARHYFKGWLKHAAGYLIGAGLLWGMIYMTHVFGNASTDPFFNVWKVWTLVLGIDLAIAISYFVWPPKKV